MAILSWGAPALADGLSGRIRIQAGEEYDTNVHRVYDSGTPDGLTRLVLQGNLQWDSGSMRVLLNYLGGAKIFHHQTSADLVANQLDAFLGYSIQRWLAVGTHLFLQDSWIKDHDRDYFLVSQEIFQRFQIGDSFSLEPFEGLRYFLYKPFYYDNDIYTYAYNYSNLGPLLGIRANLNLGRIFSSSLYYSIDWRVFDERSSEVKVNEPIPPKRLDTRQTVGLRLRLDLRYWQKKRLVLELDPEFSYNYSNTHKYSFLWLRVRMVAGLQLPFDLTLQVLGTIQITSYPDGISTGTSATEPDADENANSVVVRLGWRFFDQLSLVLQGALYRNEFYSQEDLGSFQRETVMLGLAYDWAF